MIAICPIHLNQKPPYTETYTKSLANLAVKFKVKRMQRSGTEAVRTKLQPSKPKRKITNSQNTKRTYGQPSEQLYPKSRPLSNKNRTQMSLVVRKPVFGGSDQVDTNQAVQPQKMAKGFKFRIYISYVGRRGLVLSV